MSRRLCLLLTEISFDFIVLLVRVRLIIPYLLSAILFECIGQVTYPNLLCIFLRFLLFNGIWFMILVYKCEHIQNRYTLEEKKWWNLDGWKFELEVARVLRKVGYRNIRVTKGSHDDGVDIIFYYGKNKYIAQVKHYKTKVGPEAVRALYGVKGDFRATKVVMIASSGVTEMSYKFIKNKKDYLLWTLKDIIEMDKCSRN